MTYKFYHIVTPFGAEFVIKAEGYYFDEVSGTFRFFEFKNRDAATKTHLGNVPTSYSIVDGICLNRNS